MVPPRSLLSLNQDVLREILAHLLLDTPPEPHRAAVLRTCTLLHELGLPLLYQVVDLRDYKDSQILLEHWRRLFCEEGLLIVGGRREDLAKMVKELRLGGEPYPGDSDWDYLEVQAEETARRLTIQQVSLPSCSRLVVYFHNTRGLLQTLLGPLLTQLPVTDLRLEFQEYPDDHSEEFYPIHLPPSDTLTTFLFGPSSHSCLWAQLHTVVFREHFWYESYRDGSWTLSFSDWSFKVLVVEVTRKSTPLLANGRKFFEVLCPNVGNEEHFLVDTERIEVRTDGVGGGTFEEEMRKEVAARPLDASHRRILELVVFVGEDGEERRLLEE